MGSRWEGWGDFRAVEVHNFSYGLLNPGLAYLVSCLGCFLGLQCAARARALAGASRARWLLLGGTIIGLGVASMHYMGMWAMRMPDTIGYSTGLLGLSVLIAMVAGTAALWAALRLGGLRNTLIASLIMGVAVSGRPTWRAAGS